jgi:hypothetical protein
MEGIIVARQDYETRVWVYERWSPEWIQRYVLREDGSKEILWEGQNPYQQVPWVEITHAPPW